MPISRKGGETLKIKALLDFRDREADLKPRKEGAVFEANKTRAEYLITIGFAEASEADTAVQRLLRQDGSGVSGWTKYICI